ncbi:FAD/NAD(P)-binding domain-containing protein [Nemania sp. FL0916]|nr:FAD/NAD(P)-binding domain-containing protein [Nemania sp. FL0916]
MSCFRIAIIGGGLAGATVAKSLLSIPHIEVNVYESAPQFSERGLGIGLSQLALQALEKIIPDATSLLKRDAGAVEIGASRIVIGSGPKAGSLVFDVEGDVGLAMNRAPLLKTLLAQLPQDILHASKKLVGLKQNEDGVLVTFEDGSSVNVDAVIGADGIFSTVRRHVLAETAEEYAASPAGWWECRNLIPVETAKRLIGEESFNIDREYCWAGEGAFMMHAPVEKGTKVQCIVSAVDKDSSLNRKRPITRQVLEGAFGASWAVNPVTKGMIEVMLNQEDPKGYSIWEHKHTPTYSNGRVCLVGDAAHALSPWQGAGGGIAVEDALVLGHLIQNVSSKEQLEPAFKAFDAVRRTRCQAIVDSSRETGLLLCGQNETVGVDAEGMSDALGPLFGHIDSLDLDTHTQLALDELRKHNGK